MTLEGIVDVTDDHTQTAWLELKAEHERYLKARRKRLWSYIGICSLFGFGVGIAFGSVLSAFLPLDGLSPYQAGQVAGAIASYWLFAGLIISICTIPVLKFLILRPMLARQILIISLLGLGVSALGILAGIVIGMQDGEPGTLILLSFIGVMIFGLSMIAAKMSKLSGISAVTTERIEERAIIIAANEATGDMA